MLTETISDRCCCPNWPPDGDVLLIKPKWSLRHSQSLQARDPVSTCSERLFFIPVGSYTAIHGDLCPQTTSVKGSKRKKLSWHSCFNIQILHRSDTVTASKVYLSLSLILSQNYLLVRISVWMVAVVNLTVRVICITIRWSPKHFQIRTRGRGGRERT